MEEKEKKIVIKATVVMLIGFSIVAYFILSSPGGSHKQKMQETEKSINNIQSTFEPIAYKYYQSNPPNNENIKITYNKYPNGELYVNALYLKYKENGTSYSEYLPHKWAMGYIFSDDLNTNITVFMEMKQIRTLVGQYTNGAKAYKTVTDIVVINWPNKEIMGKYTVIGDDPPSEITYRTENAVSKEDVDVNNIRKWIESLDTNNTL